MLEPRPMNYKSLDRLLDKVWFGGNPTLELLDIVETVCDKLYRKETVIVSEDPEVDTNLQLYLEDAYMSYYRALAGIVNIKGGRAYRFQMVNDTCLAHIPAERPGYVVTGVCMHSQRTIMIAVGNPAKKVFKDIRHEVRHMWQKRNFQPGTLSFDSNAEYASRFVEVDARKFEVDYHSMVRDRNI